MTLNIPFDNSYGRLPAGFYTRQAPTPVQNPEFIAVNDDLAIELGLDPAALRSAEGLAALSGNSVPYGADPLAQAYAGHQFGGWSPQLGDGRALLLGEIIDTNNLRRDLQLKGSGQTAYSRRGDGRSALGPVIREYIVSEAMHALGVPTTRALAAVHTGERVQRETATPGGILTRIASSHIRVGTFQFFASRQDIDGLRALTDHVMGRHYPTAINPLDMLDQVIQRHANLIAHWMGLGFIHGVMNTDNSHIAGDTIDYGPCAFMDEYHPNTVFSSIDRTGRYAYGRQPDMAVWNLAQLATSLLPLIDDNQEVAVEKATASIHRFPDLFQTAWLEKFQAKIGLTQSMDGDVDLIEDLLKIMAEKEMDFTNTFRALAEERITIDSWSDRWMARRALETASTKDQTDLMTSTNPAVIPRNHQVEIAIKAGLSGDYQPFLKLHEVLKSPFNLALENAGYANPPAPDEVVHQTFCGT